MTYYYDYNITLMFIRFEIIWFDVRMCICNYRVGTDSVHEYAYYSEQEAATDIYTHAVQNTH